MVDTLHQSQYTERLKFPNTAYSEYSNDIKEIKKLAHNHDSASREQARIKITELRERIRDGQSRGILIQRIVRSKLESDPQTPINYILKELHENGIELTKAERELVENILTKVVVTFKRTESFNRALIDRVQKSFKGHETIGDLLREAGKLMYMMLTGRQPKGEVALIEGQLIPGLIVSEEDAVSISPRRNVGGHYSHKGISIVLKFENFLRPAFVKMGGMELILKMLKSTDYYFVIQRRDIDHEVNHWENRIIMDALAEEGFLRKSGVENAIKKH